MKNPCQKNCNGRSPDCHATCEKYLAFYQHNREQNAQKEMEFLAERVLIGKSRATAARMQRRLRKEIKMRFW